MYCTRTSQRRWQAIEKIAQEAFIYPGHPLLLGWIIMELYPDHDHAKQPDIAGYPACLSDQRIPGSMRAIKTALELVASARPVREIIRASNSLWCSQHTDEISCAEGTLKIMDLFPLFFRAYARWAEEAEPYKCQPGLTDSRLSPGNLLHSL